MSKWIDVCRADELTPGNWEMADLEHAEIAVFNLDGQFYAIEDICSHDGGYLMGGKIEGDQIICPRHNAHFSIKSGEALSPPAYEPIATFPVRIKEGRIQVLDEQQN